MTRLLDRTHLLALLRLTKPHQAFPGLIGPVCLMSKCHKAFIDKMPRVNVSQPLVRQALFLIGTNRMFLLTNKQGDIPSLRRCYSHDFSPKLFYFKMKLFFYYNTTFLSNVTIGLGSPSGKSSARTSINLSHIRGCKPLSGPIARTKNLSLLSVSLYLTFIHYSICQ